MHHSSGRRSGSTFLRFEFFWKHSDQLFLVLDQVYDLF